MCIRDSVSVVLCFSQILYSLVRYQTVDMNPIYLIAAAFAGSLVYISINLPIMFRFGSEKGRIWGIVLVVVFMSLTSITMLSDGDSLSLLETAQNHFGMIVLIAVLAALVIMSVSACISMALYRKKEL